MPTKRLKVREVSLPEIISKATETGNPDLYINHAQFMVSGSEVFIDLYYISPVTGETGAIKAALKQRLIIPHALVKGFADGLMRAKDEYEIAMGTKTPDLNSEIKQPDPFILKE